ncbi:prepilin-type N-terminal cleavage/methylation domain-containing protein [Cellulomonas sp. PS-H5]|uniref:type IV pilus modification PilV family protein n=1 Tax=Cellulomonas sp. PS-H5 TaxID=2820400 RepID=UPI001C4EBCB4|nr:type II secretion system protein [Cellulomonas sp. PS-H5]MBW0255844.1 type II secretion system GspH family protein [Cellulomonas sp. PS-H5]
MTPGQRLARLRRARDDGFTLVESVVATTLFGIFAATLLTFVMGTFRMSVETQRRVAATHLASSVVAEARELAAQPLAAAAGGPVTPTIDPTFLDDTSTVEVGGVPFQVTRTARVVTPDGADVCSAGLSAAVASAALVEVAVEVSWETGSSPVRLTERAALAERSFVAVRVHDETTPVPGLKVELLSSPHRTGSAPTVSSALTGADGCAVFEVDPTADPAPHHWYAVQAGNAAQASAQYVTADGRFSTGAQYLGRAEAGTVRSAVVEVRREGTLRFTVLDEAGEALVGPDLEDLPVTLVPADGAAPEQVRSTAEIDDALVADDRTLTSWRYPMRHQDVAAGAVWWDGTPGLVPEQAVITLHPDDQEIAHDGSATLEVAATGEEPLHVLWQASTTGGLDWGDVAEGEEMFELELVAGAVLPGNYPVRDGLMIRAVVSNAIGFDVSRGATVRVLTEQGELLHFPRPEVTVPPMSQSAAVGDRLTFEAQGTAEGDLVWMVWQRSTDRGRTWQDLVMEQDLWTWETPVLTSEDHGAWYRVVVVGGGFGNNVVASQHAVVSLFQDTREFTLRALWPTDYTLWLGSRPGSLAPVTLPPGGTVDVALSLTGEVLAVRDADGVVTIARGGAG